MIPLKGDKAISPGQRPGCCCSRVLRPEKGKSNYMNPNFNAFALSGRQPKRSYTQGVALGWMLIGLSGRYFSKVYRTTIKLYLSL